MIRNSKHENSLSFEQNNEETCHNECMTTDKNSDLEVPGDQPDPVDAFLFAVDALREIQAAAAGLAAMEMAMLAAVSAQAEALTSTMRSPVANREMAIRTACAEIGAALRVSDRTVQARISHACDVTSGFPRVFEALRRGLVTPAHVNVIVRASANIPAGEARAEYEVAALERAVVTTPGRLGAILPSIAQQIHATSLSERHQRARAERRVEVRDTEDGMAELLAVLPAVLAHGIYDRLTSMARSVAQADPDDERTRDHVRADALCDLALGGGAVAHGDGLSAIRGVVQVSVPVLTLAGLSDRGAELLGSSPVDAETARRLAGAASGWTRVMTDPVTGTAVAVDRYRPSESLRRTIQVRDEHCRFPGCRQPGIRCDADHSHAAAEGGETCIENLALLCRRHHVLKHAAGWMINHLASGILKWTSPSGRTYTDVPTPVLRFYPSDAADGAAASGDPDEDPPQVDPDEGPPSGYDPPPGDPDGPATWHDPDDDPTPGDDSPPGDALDDQWSGDPDGAATWGDPDDDPEFGDPDGPETWVDPGDVPPPGDL